MELVAGECLLASASQDLPQALVDRVGLGFESGERLGFLRVGVQVEASAVAVAAERGVSPLLVEVLAAEDEGVVDGRALQRVGGGGVGVVAGARASR